MPNLYTQNFSLKDIFNNRNLRNKIPLINYKETEREDGKISIRTNVKTVNRLAFDIATSAARPYYKNIKTTRNGDVMEISGELVGSHDSAVDAVYNALLSQQQMFVWTANNASMIRDALKESEKNKRNYGVNSKLYLKAQSMEQIQGMTNKQLQTLMSNIMENIIYGDDFPKTQQKYGVTNKNYGAYSYERRQKEWKQKVGYD